MCDKNKCSCLYKQCVLWHIIFPFMEAKEDMVMAVKKTEAVKTKKTAVKATTRGLKRVAKPVAVKTAEKKVAAPKSVKAAPKRAAQKAAAKQVVRKTSGHPVIQPPPRTQDVIPVESKPSARTCPLVLDGIIASEDFSPKACFSCDEFDCRFYSAEESPSVLGSRLFASDEGDDGFGDDDGEDGFGGFYEDADADDDGYDDMR
jgi:hypothetical protein